MNSLEEEGGEAELWLTYCSRLLVCKMTVYLSLSLLTSHMNRIYNISYVVGCPGSTDIVDRQFTHQHASEPEGAVDSSLDQSNESKNWTIFSVAGFEWNLQVPPIFSAGGSPINA